MASKGNILEWNYPRNPPIFTKPGSFTAWIKATKFPAPDSVSAFAYLIKRSDDRDAPHEEQKASAGSESTEQQAHVAAAYRVIEALPANSSVLIHCRATFIVEAINGRVNEWAAGNWTKKIAQAPIWRRYLEARDGTDAAPRNIMVSALHWQKGEWAEIEDNLGDRARSECNNRVEEIRNQPAGFGTRKRRVFGVVEGGFVAPQRPLLKPKRRKPAPKVERPSRP